MGKRWSFAGVGVCLALAWTACSRSDEESPVPSVLELTTFDVAEAGWGDAPLPVHFVWSIKNDGRSLQCKLDRDGDGTIDKEIASCRADTIKDALADLPTYTFTN